MAEGPGNAPGSGVRTLFSRQVQPAYICLPSKSGQGGRSCTLMAVRKHPPRSEQGRLLLTLHPEIGCQGWTRTNTERLNRPPCYFDTTWQWLIGAAGRSCTCISSFRRRTPRLFRPRQHSEMVGAAGFPPATSRSQAGRSEY